MTGDAGNAAPAGTGMPGWFGGAPAWPALFTVLLGLLACGIAWLGNPLWSLIAYGALLTVGAVLVGVQRRLCMQAGVGRTGKAITMPIGETVTLLVLVVGAMASGWVVALDVARRLWAG